MERRVEKVRTEISKVFYDEKFSHWEMDIYLDGENIGGGTGPTYYSVSDMADEMLNDYLHDDTSRKNWFDDDSNEQKR